MTCHTCQDQIIKNGVHFCTLHGCPTEPNATCDSWEEINFGTHTGGGFVHDAIRDGYVRLEKKRK